MRKNKKGQGKAIKLTLHQNKPQQVQMQHEVRSTERKYTYGLEIKKSCCDHIFCSNRLSFIVVFDAMVYSNYVVERQIRSTMPL